MGLLGDFLPELFDLMEGLGDERVLLWGGVSSTGGGAAGATSSSGGDSTSLGILGGKFTIAAVSAMLCCEDVNVAVQAEEYWTFSTGFGKVGST